MCSDVGENYTSNSSCTKVIIRINLITCIIQKGAHISKAVSREKKQFIKHEYQNSGTDMCRKGKRW